MRKYIRINGKWNWFDLIEDKQTAVFAPFGNILASAIFRMNKNRYKVYIIWKGGAAEMIFYGVGEAMDFLQKEYDYELRKIENP